ncbi:CD209 antigen-like protein 2, partial [Biomphalaria glabrata]
IITASEIKIFKFKMFPNNATVKMWSVGPGYEATSVSACATLCSKYVQECYSFTYNRKSKLCTP